ncbi:MAG TPA: hypothetical protein VGN72_04280 [Tepidisphaeraceae bacterium]|nr:hypothetical protein [Tepidisphaeraceae bacterium]
MLRTIVRSTSNQRKKIKRGNTAQFISAGREAIKLQTDGGWQKYLFISLAGTLTFAAGANNTRTAAKPGDEWALVKNLKIVMFGKDIWNGSGEELRAMQRVWFGRDAQTVPALGDGTTASVVFDSTLVFPFVDNETIRPYDTLHDGRSVGDARLEIEWETTANANSGATAAAAQLSTTLYNMFGYSGIPVDLKRHVRNQGTIAAAGEMTIELDIYGQSFISHVLHVESNSTGADLPNVVTAIRIENGGDDPIDLSMEQFRQAYNLLAQTSTDLLQTSADQQYFADPYRSDGSDARAWLYVPHVDPIDKLATESYDTTGTQVLRLIITCNAACKVTVLSNVREPDPKAALAA